MSKKYITKNHCIECNCVLTYKEMFYSNGTCPHCGHTNSSTIVDVKKVLYVEESRKPTSLFNTILDFFNPNYKIRK